MEPGQHISTIGSTMPALREVDETVFGRAAIVVVDSRGQVADESGDILAALKAGTYPESQVVELEHVVANGVRRRSDDDITVYKSVGTGVQDVMAGFILYQAAKRAGRGRDIGEFPEVKVMA
jgi:ornithine cyclodeaminase/alanine dehydrogenase-like protein (mu-crystallin family)